jgi:SAM-dependent methyltransferase
MTTQAEIKNQVREFYNQIGWQEISEGLYQNARYEDLRPVSQEYIHRCHMRVKRYLKSDGYLMLDAGSGPIQYPQYLEYSQGYRYRVCVDITMVALQEARKRIGDHGLFVVADVANLPFQPRAFDGVVSLHTIHHLPEDEHLQAYAEVYRVLAANSAAVVVNGWPTSQLMDIFDPLVRLSNRLRYYIDRIIGRTKPQRKPKNASPSKGSTSPKGTFTSRHNVEWVKSELAAQVPVEIFVWRSVSVRLMRALIHPKLGGRAWLRLLYWLEERYPRYFGENGKYPLIVMRRFKQ